MSESHQEIASHIVGTVRELVSRNLSRFQAEGGDLVSTASAASPALEAMLDQQDGQDSSRAVFFLPRCD